MEIIDKKEFTKAILNKNIEAFIVYMTSFNFNLIPIYLAKEAQIVLLVAKKVKILIKYLDFSDVFFKEKASILSKATKLNQHVIKLQKD